VISATVHSSDAGELLQLKPPGQRMQPKKTAADVVPRPIASDIKNLSPPET